MGSTFVAALGLLGRLYIFLSLAVVVAASIFIAVNRSQAAYQKSLVRLVKNIKRKRNEFENEKDAEKLPKKEKSYHKAVKNLENKIKTIMFFNKNIIISNSTLLSEENLALTGKTPFTFNSKLDELINEYNKKHKRHKTINNTRNANVQTEVIARELTEEERQLLSEQQNEHQVQQEEQQVQQNEQETVQQIETTQQTNNENLERNIYQEENLFNY